MPHPIDIHVGRRLRARRRMLCLTQEKLADSVDIRFQQIQKYESGANRISASRLWSLSRALDVSISYFFEGMNGYDIDNAQMLHKEFGFNDTPPAAELLDDKETIDLVRYYYQLNEGPRKKLLDLAKAMSGE